ncbi:hypothetical protein [Trinickia dabaoshanensis]|nr:hypothetical protein [Trinickia dabaoshanensis]
MKRSFVVLMVSAAALAAMGSLSGCVVAPAAPAYGYGYDYYQPAYGYYPGYAEPSVGIGIGFGDGWGGHGWGDHDRGDHDWHGHGGWHGRH